MKSEEVINRIFDEIEIGWKGRAITSDGRVMRFVCPQSLTLVLKGDKYIQFDHVNRVLDTGNNHVLISYDYIDDILEEDVDLSLYNDLKIILDEDD